MTLLAGVTLAVATGQQWLDPLIAIVVGLKIGGEGIHVFRRSISGLMDAAIVPDEREAVKAKEAAAPAAPPAPSATEVLLAEIRDELRSKR